jgi:hypothetical protein
MDGLTAFAYWGTALLLVLNTYLVYKRKIEITDEKPKVDH